MRASPGERRHRDAMRELDQLPLLTLADIVAGHARFVPAKTALVSGDERLTWLELDRRITQVANGLLGLGLVKGDRVALITANGAAMVEILLGINRAGCVMVPLSLLAPGEALVRMIADSGARALFVSPGFEGVIGPRLEAFPGLAEGAFGVGFEAPGWRGYQPWRDRQPTARPAVRLDHADECVIIYSSGTTGAPKGIVHTQYNRTQFALGVALEFRFTTESVALVTTPLYSNGTWLMFLPALMGAGPVGDHDEVRSRHLSPIGRARADQPRLHGSPPIPRRTQPTQPPQHRLDLASTPRLGGFHPPGRDQAADHGRDGAGVARVVWAHRGHRHDPPARGRPSEGRLGRYPPVRR